RHVGAALILSVTVACAPAIHRTTSAPPSGAELEQLWSEPTDLTSRDLYYGPGGKDGGPVIQGKLEIKSFDPSGNSVGYNVLDAEGREWKAKIGEEAQPEVRASGLLWAIGLH